MQSQMRTTGHLLKKGGSRAGLRRNWKKRWFVLDMETGELAYYKDASCERWKGTVQLTADSSVGIPDSVALRGRHRPSGADEVNFFELRRCSERAAPFKLRASGSDELAEWLRSLKNCLNILRQAAGRPTAAARPRASTAEEREPRPDSESGEYSSEDDDDADESPDEDDYPEVRASMRIARLSLSSEGAAASALAEARPLASPPPTPDAAAAGDPWLPAAPEPVAPPAAPVVAAEPPADGAAREPSSPDRPARPPGWRPPPPKRGAEKKEEELARLVALATSTNAAALEAAVDGALGCGVDFDSAEMVAARTQLAFLADDGLRASLVDTDATDARAALDAALAGEPTTASLGDAIGVAVAAGLDPDGDAMQRAQTALCELLQRDDPKIATWC